MFERTAALARSLDVLVAGAALLVLAPLLTVVAALLAADGPGPVLVGSNRLRFRSMRMEADGRAVERGALGTLLWLTRLNELPQFVSLLKGDVSLFGAGAPALNIGT